MCSFCPLYHPVSSCFTLFHPVQNHTPCTMLLFPLYLPVPLFIPLYHTVSRTTLYHPVSPCTTLYHPASLWLTLHHPVPPWLYSLATPCSYSAGAMSETLLYLRLVPPSCLLPHCPPLGSTHQTLHYSTLLYDTVSLIPWMRVLQTLVPPYL